MDNSEPMDVVAALRMPCGTFVMSSIAVACSSRPSRISFVKCELRANGFVLCADVPLYTASPRRCVYSEMGVSSSSARVGAMRSISSCDSLPRGTVRCAARRNSMSRQSGGKSTPSVVFMTRRPLGDEYAVCAWRTNAPCAAVSHCARGASSGVFVLLTHHIATSTRGQHTASQARDASMHAWTYEASCASLRCIIAARGPSAGRPV